MSWWNWTDWGYSGWRQAFLKVLYTRVHPYMYLAICMSIGCGRWSRAQSDKSSSVESSIYASSIYAVDPFIGLSLIPCITDLHTRICLRIVSRLLCIHPASIKNEAKSKC